MSELQERFRAQAMMAVWRLREWRKTRCEKPAFHDNLIELEGVFLKRQCEDAVTLYRLAHKTYFALYRQAMAAYSGRTLYSYDDAQKAGAAC